MTFRFLSLHAFFTCYHRITHSNAQMAPRRAHLTSNFYCSAQAMRVCAPRLWLISHRSQDQRTSTIRKLLFLLWKRISRLRCPLNVPLSCYFLIKYKICEIQITVRESPRDAMISMSAGRRECTLMGTVVDLNCHSNIPLIYESVCFSGLLEVL